MCILPCRLFILSCRSFHLGCPMQVKASLCWKLHCLLERRRTVQSLSADTPFTVVPNSSRPKEGGRGARAPLLWSQTLVSRENTQRFPFKKTIPQKRTFRNWALLFAYMLLGGPFFKPMKHSGQCFVMSWSNQTFLSCIHIISSSGFFTAKGNLVSSIMYPQPINFRFYQDAAKFLLILGFVGERMYLCLFVCVGPVHLQECPSFLSISWHSL